MLVVGCGSGPGRAVASGVAGRVLSAPSCPVTRDADPCPDRPVPGAVVMVARRRTVADADGRFRLAVPAGRHLLAVRAPHAAAYPAPASVPVSVRAGRYTRVRVTLDSGIR